MGSPWLLGDPGGLRSGLEARGITLDLFWNHEVGVLLGAGGDGDVAQSGSADFFLRADLARLGIGVGGRVLAQVKSNYNRNVNDDAAPLVISLLKEELRVLAESTPLNPNAFERIQALRRQIYDSADYQEGIRSFFERRPPRFQGR